METGSYGSITYSHDKTGNRLSMTESGTTTTYSYEAASNRLTQVNNNSRSYDLAGMMTSSENGKYKYSYNDGNRLESLSEKTGKVFFVMPIKDTGGEVTGAAVTFFSKYSKTQYLYDGFGRRTESVLASGNGDRYHYHYDQSGRLLGFTVYDSNDIHLLNKEFIWLDNMPVAQADTTFTPTGAIESSTITWLHTDHLNTPLLATNAAGNVIWRWDRNGFGTIGPDTDPDGDGNHVDIPLRFPGQVKVQGDGNLYYNMHRFYESGTGRYMTPDPIGLIGGINLYRYANADPINWFDPDGLEVTMVCRPVKSWKARLFGAKHCAVFVWHWEEKCGKRYKVIDSQYSLAANQTPFPQGTDTPTYNDDLEAFNNPNNENEHYDIPAPSGMSQEQFDNALISSGNTYNSGEPYNVRGGPNSNTATDNIIEGAGGIAPDVPGAYHQNYGE